MTRGAVLLALLLSCLGARPASAQVFLASRPDTGLEIGPVFVRGVVSPALGPVTVDVFFSVVVPPHKSGSDLEHDLYLIWPGAVTATGKGKPDPSLARYAEDRRFTVVDQGTLDFRALNLYRVDGELPPEPVPGGAPFVTFLRQGGALGVTSPATYVRIPWTPRLLNRAWIMDLRMVVNGLVTRKQATWVEEAFWGRRYLVSLTFQDLRSRATFPIYFEARDRVLRLSEDPSQIMINFERANHLKIDQVSPPSASRRRSETRADTEIVSLFLDRSSGMTPQVLTIGFGYFSGVQAWMPILIPMVFFVLGNLAGPLLKEVGARVARGLAGRFQIGRAAQVRSTGVVVSRDTLARIAPGETTYEQVLGLCGPDAEEHEDLATPGIRTLVYRGQRVVPRRRRTFGWFATVSHWDVEHHEVQIKIEGDRVRDLQARVRRSRVTSGGG